MSHDPALMESIASASLSCAMDPIRPMGPREKAETLIRIADHYPHLIKAEAAKLRAQADLLLSYLRPPPPSGSDE